MNVNLIEPNDVNINTNIVNGIPQYQDMYIFAELTAIRKARTVLVKTDENTYSSEVTGLENTVRVNFLGNNQNTGIVVDNETIANPNYLNFTTNYYQGSSGNQTQYEGFGISDIKITINSSFVPQVNIQFVDIRGVAFFNQLNSPYRILFDFPPPIFTLTIKGYFGKALTYQLHLVKYTSEFKSENGNFVIDAQFIAMTYAPLTDVLFRYAINFPLMVRNYKGVSPSPDKRPTCTDDLITKLKALLPAISKAVKAAQESSKYDLAIKQLDNTRRAFEMLSNYKDDLKENGDAFLMVYDRASNTNSTEEYPTKITQISNLSGYNQNIYELGTDADPQKINKRLLIAYQSGNELGKKFSYKEEDFVTPQYKSNTDAQISALNAYRSKITSKMTNAASSAISFDVNDVAQASPLPNYYDVSKGVIGKTSSLYATLDITNLYVKLYRNYARLKSEKRDAAAQINIIVNNIILSQLGMMPTIYNIFKVILDDVDTFFETIRQVSIEAENNHHNIPDYKKIIMGGEFGDSKKPDTVFAFPLIINRQGIICGGTREERIAPIELSNRLPKPFPEMTLVNEFIDTFFMQDFRKTLPNMKSEQNEDGTNVWIPISPFDSEVGSNTVASPYMGKDGGIDISENDKLTEIFKTFLQRFYILSQNALSDTFYGTNSNVRDAYIQMFAESEAINMASSIINPDYSNALKHFADTIGKTPAGFYNYLNNNKGTSDLYGFIEADKPFMPLSATDNAYVSKNNTGYTGVFFPTIPIDELIPNDEAKRPVDDFMSKVKTTPFWQIISGEGRNPESFYTFTKQNVLYIKDVLRNKQGQVTKSMDINEDICLDTRFLANKTINSTKVDDANWLLAYGNSRIGTISGFGTGSDASNLKSFDNIVDVWVDQLTENDVAIYPSISGSSKLSAIVLLSNFGYALSPFNLYPKNLGRLIFNNPAAIEIPQYLSVYIGALVDANSDSNLINELKSFFLTGNGKDLNSHGMYIFADIYDVNNNLSENDKQTFKLKFDRFYENIGTFNYETLLTQYRNLYNEVQGLMSGITSHETKARKNIYTELLSPIESKKGATYYDTMLKPLIQREIMGNYSQTTFKTYDTNTQAGYQSLKATNNSSKRNVNNSFFEQFFRKLSSQIVEKQNKNKEQEEKNKKLKGDKDVITQTYYSFKNINDKWLSNPIKANTYGYPFNGDSQRLIDSFVFVDRAMNPIGDTMINPESLIQMYDDPNISVFSVISQLLSSNGFEFFPLQNFMKFEGDDWKESFKINTGPIGWQKPTFVCMYIGGSSRYPNNMTNGFEEDGIIDLGNTSATDFNTGDCNNIDPTKDNQAVRNPNFPWRQVRAFKVRFGEQNQSMFTGIKIDSKEFPETNESINILSRLAGDGGAGAPIPKGQNLYNVYENRAYRASIAAMGNAMIQPTQYFQLENVPLFNGAYLILSVEHEITPNKMMTSFSGTKILRFPVPRVLNPAAIFGVNDSADDSRNIEDLSPGEIIQGTQAVTISTPRLAELNSVFGIDVSQAQGNFNWNKAVNPTSPDDQKPKFAFIKVTEGRDWQDPQRVNNANGAKGVGLKIGYYHYAFQFSENNNDAIIANAKTQAKNFIDTVNAMPHKPDFPLVLDMESYEQYDKNKVLVKSRYWSPIKTNNDLWINTFVNELKKAKYDTILYGGKYWFQEYTSDNFSSIPLWHAQYPYNPEETNPTVATGWQKGGDKGIQTWTAWQFSSQGRINGHTGDIDLNVMKESYFNSLKIT